MIFKFFKLREVVQMRYTYFW